MIKKSIPKKKMAFAKSIIMQDQSNITKLLGAVSKCLVECGDYLTIYTKTTFSPHHILAFFNQSITVT